MEEHVIEVVLAIIGLLGGLLIGIGWYKRGFSQMERELVQIQDRVCKLEEDGAITKTDLAVIKERMASLDTKISDIHKVIMGSVKLGQ